MRISLNEIKVIEGYLLDEVTPEERQWVEARMRTDYAFRVHVHLQKKLYTLLRFYHRRRLQRTAEDVHERLFHSPDETAFQKSIFQLFNH
jgi:hypothetical protein